MGGSASPSLDGVGQTDVQTIGADTSGQLTQRDALNSGTIDNLDRYGQVIQYLQRVVCQ